MKTVLALIFCLLFFTLGCSLRVYGCRPPLFLAMQQLITWSHLFFHTVYCALAKASLPCAITNTVGGLNTLCVDIEHSCFSSPRLFLPSLHKD